MSPDNIVLIIFTETYLSTLVEECQTEWSGSCKLGDRWSQWTQLAWLVIYPKKNICNLLISISPSLPCNPCPSLVWETSSVSPSPGHLDRRTHQRQDWQSSVVSPRAWWWLPGHKQSSTDLWSASSAPCWTSWHCHWPACWMCPLCSWSRWPGQWPGWPPLSVISQIWTLPLTHWPAAGCRGWRGAWDTGRSGGAPWWRWSRVWPGCCCTWSGSCCWFLCGQDHDRDKLSPETGTPAPPAASTRWCWWWWRTWADTHWMRVSNYDR